MTRSMLARGFAALCRGFAALCLVVVAALPASAQTVQLLPARELPQGEGRDLVAVACSQCHALNVILSVREGPAGWRHHVNNMVLRGAQLTPREAETVIRYFTNNLGPGAGPAYPVKQITLPAGAGKELVESRCSSCHDLERVTGIKRHGREWAGVVTNMVGRGAAATPDEAKSITAYLVSQFGSD